MDCNIDVRQGPVHVAWFAGGRTNLCYNCLDRNVQRGLGDELCFVWEGNEPGALALHPLQRFCVTRARQLLRRDWLQSSAVRCCFVAPSSCAHCHTSCVCKLHVAHERLNPVPNCSAPADAQSTHAQFAKLVLRHMRCAAAAHSKSMTYAQVLAEVSRMANWLSSQGVHAGDSVAIYLPMVLQLPITMLACARIGAVHSVVFGGFSADALASRVMDSAPRVLVTATGVMRGAKAVPLKRIADEACAACARKGHEVLFARAQLSYGRR